MALSSDSAFVQVNVRYRVEGLDKAAADTRKATTAFGDLGKTLKSVGASLLAFKAVDTIRQGFIDVTKSLIESNAQFEKFEVQLKVFSGRASEAAELMDFLAERSTQLGGGLEDLLKGSTALQTFGIDVRENLQLIADIAQATNRNIEDVAVAFGRIVAGDPRTKQFLTTRRGDVDEFNRSLERGESRLKATQAAFRRFTGVSAELAGTWSRLTENLNDVLFVAAKIVGNQVFGAIRTDLQGIVDALTAEVFDEEGRQRTSGFFVELGRSIGDAYQSIKDFLEGWEEIQRVLGNFQGGRRGFSDFDQEQESISSARNIRSIFGKDFINDAVFGIKPSELDINLRTRFQQWAFAFFGLNEQGLAPEELEARTARNIAMSAQKIRDAAREESAKLAEQTQERHRQKGVLEDFLGIVGDRKELKEKIKTSFEDARSLAEEMEIRRKFPEEEIEQFPELDPDVQDARLNAEMAFQQKLMRLELDVNAAIEKSKEEAVENARRREEELMQARFQMAQRLTDRAVGDLGFVLFGGRGANARIDAQVAQLQREVDVLDGVTAPLTRQEELMNRIVELESQRISINERLGSIVRRTLGDLAQAVAKAALLRAFGFGTERRGQGGGGGFLGLLKTGLEIASAIPGPHQGFAGVAAGITAPFSGGSDQFGGFESGFSGAGAFQSSKPAMRLNKPVIVNNPIFLSNDVRNVAEKFAVESEKRMR